MREYRCGILELLKCCHNKTQETNLLIRKAKRISESYEDVGEAQKSVVPLSRTGKVLLFGKNFHFS